MFLTYSNGRDTLIDLSRQVFNAATSVISRYRAHQDWCAALQLNTNKQSKDILLHISLHNWLMAKCLAVAHVFSQDINKITVVIMKTSLPFLCQVSISLWKLHFQRKMITHETP